MADNRLMDCPSPASNCFKEAVCIDAGRVYDSCCDRDCLEDLRIYFTECGQSIVENAIEDSSEAGDITAKPLNEGGDN